MQKNKKTIVTLVVFLILVIIAVIFVRTYHFHDWLYFKMDQARDSFLVANAIENGPQELPLLGPRAGATELEEGFLRLGPIFYYFQYISGVLFNSTSPDVFAYPDLFFSILVLPLLYLFCRTYFKKNISLLVVLMYAFSFLVIQYSRFSWNPNSLPFFTILTFLALLKTLNSQDEKTKKWWVILLATGLAVGSQLHFVGFFSLVGVSGLLILYHYRLWKKEEIRGLFEKYNFRKLTFYCGIFLAVFLFFYTPVIISDVMKGGENAKNFFMALDSKPTGQTFSQKIIENFSQQVEHYTLITTAYIYPKKMDLKESLPIVFSIVIFVFGIYLIIRNTRKNSDLLKKDFLMLLLFWFWVFFILCIPLAFQIRPRFFLFTFAIPFLFLGLIFEFLEEQKIKYYKHIIVILTLIVLFSNISGTVVWFKEQAESQDKDIPIKRTLILKTKDGVTLGQLQGAVDYIYTNKRKGANVYFYVKPEHVRPIKYLFKLKNDPAFYYESMKINNDPNAEYFAIVPTGSETSKIENKFKEEVEILAYQNFGQISVYKINFKNRQISNEFEPEDAGEENESSRIFWKDLF
jgi:4-amino-4-deoxy-L-arabinose transferase-like glycosyltransferase